MNTELLKLNKKEIIRRYINEAINDTVNDFFGSNIPKERISDDELKTVYKNSGSKDGIIGSKTFLPSNFAKSKRDSILGYKELDRKDKDKNAIYPEWVNYWKSVKSKDSNTSIEKAKRDFIKNYLVGKKFDSYVDDQQEHFINTLVNRGNFELKYNDKPVSLKPNSNQPAKFTNSKEAKIAINNINKNFYELGTSNKVPNHLIQIENTYNDITYTVLHRGYSLSNEPNSNERIIFNSEKEAVQAISDPNRKFYIIGTNTEIRPTRIVPMNVLGSMETYNDMHNYVSRDNKDITDANQEATDALQKVFGSKTINADSDFFYGPNKDENDPDLTKNNLARYVWSNYTVMGDKKKAEMKRYDKDGNLKDDGEYDENGYKIPKILEYPKNVRKYNLDITEQEKNELYSIIKATFKKKTNTKPKKNVDYTDKELVKILIEQGYEGLIPSELLNLRGTTVYDENNKQKEFLAGVRYQKITQKIKENDISKIEKELSSYGIDVALTGKVFMYGNKKLPPSTLIINLTSATACPSSWVGSDEDGNCRDAECPLHDTVCYAKTSETTFNAQYASNARNQMFLRKLPHEAFAKLLHAYIMAAPYRITDIRISENGDIDSQETLEWCDELAEYVRIRYGIKTSTYTHKATDRRTNKPLDFTNIHNLNINNSHDKVNFDLKDKNILGANQFYKNMEGTSRNYLVMKGERLKEFEKLRLGYRIKFLGRAGKNIDNQKALEERNKILHAYLAPDGFVHDVTSSERNELYKKIEDTGLINTLDISMDNLPIFIDIMRLTPLRYVDPNSTEKANSGWFVITTNERVNPQDKNKERYWKCLCDCSVCRFCYNSPAENHEYYLGDDGEMHNDRTNIYVAVH